MLSPYYTQTFVIAVGCCVPMNNDKFVPRTTTQMAIVYRDG